MNFSGLLDITLQSINGFYMITAVLRTISNRLSYLSVDDKNMWSVLHSHLETVFKTLGVGGGETINVVFSYQNVGLINKVIWHTFLFSHEVCYQAIQLVTHISVLLLKHGQ